jgi:hypothetical protein
VMRNATTRNQNKPWTDEELRYLEAFYPGYNTKKVASMLGRTVTSVVSMASRYGVKRLSVSASRNKPRSRVSDEKRRLVQKALDDGLTRGDVALKYMIAPDSMYLLVNEYKAGTLVRNTDPLFPLGDLPKSPPPSRREKSAPMTPPLWRRFWSRVVSAFLAV